MVLRKNLLYVVGAGGPPFDYILPRLAQHAEVHALVFVTLGSEQEATLRRGCAGVRFYDPDPSLTAAHGDCGASEAIATEARRIGASGIITFSEFAVIAVAEACSRLGLPSAGPNARYARDKWLMRSRWSAAGVPSPAFRRVASLQDLEVAARTLRRPFILKPAGRGGGIGQQVIQDGAVLATAWESLGTTLSQASERGLADYCADFDTTHCVAEEIIESTTDSWYDEPGYEDFLSVEGIVSRGEYHPLCITARPPSLPPFTETGAISPCTLAEPLQRKIERCARAAVTALGLDTCGTHTEMKLMAGNELCLLETAARFPGSLAVGLAETVFGVDMVGLLAAELLGEPQSYPDAMLVTGSGAAAVIYLFAADARGRPWGSLPLFWWERLDWAALVSAASRVAPIPSQMIPNGSPMPAYNPGRGIMGYAGTVYLTSPDPGTLLADANRLISGLEPAVLAEASRAMAESAGTPGGQARTPGAPG